MGFVITTCLLDQGMRGTEFFILGKLSFPLESCHLDNLFTYLLLRREMMYFHIIKFLPKSVVNVGIFARKSDNSVVGQAAER